MANAKKNTRITTGIVRLSYVHLFEPTPNPSGELKYSVAILIPKSDKKTLAAISEAIGNAIENGADKFNGISKNKLKNPLRDGDEDRPGDAAYEGCYFINANNSRKPKVVNASLQEVIDPEEVYSGCYAKACITFYPFSASGNRGIACSIDAVQKIRDGESLGGGSVNVNDVFSAEDDDDDDMLG